MTDEEEMAEKYADKTFGLYCPTDQERYQVEQAFLAGLKAGRPQWHDLRDNPNDLPKESCSVLVKYEYDDRTYTDNYINDKEHNIIGWESEYEDPYCSPRVIAWVEKPQFDKE